MTVAGKYYLNSYVPLAASPRGRAAAAQFQIPPFVDGSIRRELDLEHAMPAITCLCRRDKFAPRLNVGDTVGYMTVKRRFGSSKPHRRLTAVLRVEEKLESHAAAAEWYRNRGYPLPSNCMVPDNPAQPLDRSHRCHRCADTMMDDDLHAAWDRSYWKRAHEFGTVLICRIIHHSLDRGAPVVTDSDLKRHFRDIPGTQNPGALSEDSFRKFIRALLPSASLSDL